MTGITLHGRGSCASGTGKQFQCISVSRQSRFLGLLRNIHKAQNPAQLLKLLGMERGGNMIACGDGYNDLSMIELPDSRSHENGLRLVPSAADLCYLLHNDDGVAHVVEKFFYYTRIGIPNRKSLSR